MSSQNPEGMELDDCGLRIADLKSMGHSICGETGPSTSSG
jgi:hypothetical protein